MRSFSDVVDCSKLKFPFSVCPRTVSSAGVPSSIPEISTLRYGPAGRLSEISESPTLKVSATSWPVLLMAIENVPFNETPGIFTETAAPSCPAIPASVMTKLPLPFETETKAVLPSPRLKLTLLAPIRTIRMSSAVLYNMSGPGSLVTRSKAKSPESVWPSMLNLMSDPSTRR